MAVMSLVYLLKVIHCKTEIIHFLHHDINVVGIHLSC